MFPADPSCKDFSGTDQKQPRPSRLRSWSSTCCMRSEAISWEPFWQCWTRTDWTAAAESHIVLAARWGSLDFIRVTFCSFLLLSSSFSSSSSSFLNCELQISVGATGPQPQAPDRSGHCRNRSGARGWGPAGPCQRECQNKCQIERQKEWQIECQNRCQKEASFHGVYPSMWVFYPG